MILFISEFDNPLLLWIAVFFACSALFLLLLFRKKQLQNRTQKNQLTSLNQGISEVLNTVNDGFIFFDQQQSIIHSNSRASAFYKNIVGIPLNTHFNLSDIANELFENNIIDIRQNVQKQEGFTQANFDIQREDDIERSYFIKYLPLDMTDKMKYSYILIKDTTKEALNLKNIENQRHIISEITNSTRDAYILLDENFVVRLVNQKVLESFGIDEEMILHKEFFTFFPEFKLADFAVNIDYVLQHQQSIEFEYFSTRLLAWFNIKVQPFLKGLSIFFYEITNVKINSSINDIERRALEDFSMGEISFFHINAKSFDSIQTLYPGMFSMLYMLNEESTELKYFSSGFSTFLPTVPKSLNKSFVGFEYLLQNKAIIQQNNLYFDTLIELTSKRDYTTIVSYPIFRDGKPIGILLSFLKSDVISSPNIQILHDKVAFFFEKLFNYHRVFKEFEKLSIVSENSLKASVTINLENKITWCNKSFLNLVQQHKDEIHLEYFLSIFNTTNSKFSVYPELIEAIHNFHDYKCRFEFIDPKQQTHQLQLTTNRIFTRDEIQLLIEIENITEQINYERKLRQGQDFLRKITDSVPIILFQCKLDKLGKFSFPFISREIERLHLNVTYEDLRDKPDLIYKIIFPEDITNLTNAIQISLLNNTNWNIELRTINNQGETIWLNGVGVLERSKNGEYFWFGYFENISEKKKKTRELEEINKRFTFASKAVNDIIWEFDYIGKKITWGEGIENILGYKKEFQPTYELLKDFIHPGDYNYYVESISKAVENVNTEKFQLEYRFKRTDDTYADIVDNAFILRNEKGEPERIIGAMKDVSDIKLFEKKKRNLIIETQEIERNQFSMELHDGLAQHLIALHLYLSQIEQETPPDNLNKIKLCQSIVSESLNQTRTLCYNLSPPELSKGIIHGLKALFDRLNSLNSIQFNLKIDKSLETEELSHIDIYNIYRIVQEFINNSLKHSKATVINCSVKNLKKEKTISILIHDDGVGFDFETVKFGYGIQNMYKRAKVANVQLKLSSSIASGTVLKIN